MSRIDDYYNLNPALCDHAPDVGCVTCQPTVGDGSEWGEDLFFTDTPFRAELGGIDVDFCNRCGFDDIDRLKARELLTNYYGTQYEDHCARTGGDEPVCMEEAEDEEGAMCWPDELDVPDHTAMSVKVGKAPLELIPFETLFDVVAAYEVGAGKYGRNSWREGMPYSVCASALLRHFARWHGGEDFDQADGQHHMSAIAFYALAILQYARDGREELDDRYRA